MNRVITAGVPALILLTTLLSFAHGALLAAETAVKPNVLIILADDLGFSDLGCYGSEIETPNIDRLAMGGLRFTQFYNTAKCHSSRISLLSGRYPYQAGNRSFGKSVTLPEVVAEAGYFTAMTGKWHQKQQPTDFGFQRYFGHLSGATNYFIGSDKFRLNGEPWPVPEKGFYTTVANVDHAVDFLGGARREKKPWLLYVAFNAPHSPLQPLEQDYQKYLGRYDAGWDVIRADRVAKQKKLGLFDEEFEASPRPDHIPAWSSLSSENRQWESLRMAAYAALVDRMDQEIGRLVANVKASGELDNTLILFLSDNGSSPYEKRKMAREIKPFGPKCNWALGTGWAWMGNTPFRFYKQNQFEGGIATPAIAHWPGGLKTKAGSFSDALAHVIDILPTVAEVTESSIPTTWPGRELQPIAGVSLAPVFSGGTTPPRPLYFLYSEERGLREGDWKLVSFKRNPWELYNLAEDPTEMHELASENPEVVKRLAALWYHMVENVDQAPGSRRKPVLETAKPVTSPGWTKYRSGDEHEEKKKKGTGAGKAKKKATKATAGERRPNFVIVFTDDQGYGDLSCYGGTHVDTPRIDQMAAEGQRLTSFYVAAPVCTPSRAALMTGSYPKRIEMATGSNFGVLLAGDRKGLNPDEITIAEVLKSAGYKTGVFGKWHLGDQPDFLPTRQGFDEFFGIPYSHDIHPFHPQQSKFKFPPLPLLDGESVIEMDPEADYLTKRITERAVGFIENHKDDSFFLYVPHPIPHRPLHVSPPFMSDVAEDVSDKLKLEGETVDYDLRNKLFRQAIREIDWSVGQILDALKEHDIDEHTLVIFASDNGPAVGKAGPLRGRKGSTFEGGMREPTVIRWPGRIPAGKENAELMTAMDLLPTFARLAGASLPTDRVIDGKDIWPVLAEGARTPHEAFFYHRKNELEAVRSGRWKLHQKDGKPTALYDLDKDIGEKKNRLAANPDIARRLLQRTASFDTDLADNRRPAAFVENPKPLAK